MSSASLEPDSSPVPRWLMPAIVLAGVICRVAQYLSNRSYWEDESFIVINLKYKTARELMGQLADLGPAQAAPPLWLLFQRAIVLLFGTNEFALRALALVAGVVGLLLMAVLARRVLPPLAAVFAVAIYAFSDRLIWHATEVKPYSIDAFFATLLLFIAIGVNRPPIIRLLLASLVAAVGVWWSYPVVFVYAGVSLALLPAIWAGPNRGRGLAAFVGGGAMIVASFAVVFFTIIRDQDHSDLHEYWDKYLPNYDKPLSIPFWLISRLAALGTYAAEYTGALAMVLAVAGIVWLWRRRELDRALSLGLPLLITIAAAFAERYPLDGHRINTFLLPGMILAAGFGLQLVLQSLQGVWRFRAAVAIPVLVLGPAVVLAVGYLFQPRTRSSMRPAVEYVLAHRDADDVIYTLNFHQTWVYWPDNEKPPEGFLAKNTPPTGEFWLLVSYRPGGDSEETERRLKRVRSVADPLGPPYIVPGDGGAVYRFRIRPRTTAPATQESSP